MKAEEKDMDYWTGQAKAIGQRKIAVYRKKGNKTPERVIISGTPWEAMTGEEFLIERELDGILYYITIIERRRKEPTCYTWTPVQNGIAPVTFASRQSAKAEAEAARGGKPKKTRKYLDKRKGQKK